MRAVSVIFLSCVLLARLALSLNPTATCIVGATDFNATITISTTANSASPPYGFGSSWTFVVTGSKASNNTWELRQFAPFGNNGCSRLGGVFFEDVDVELGLMMDGTVTTPNIALVGRNSIMGRSIVVFDPVNPNVILGCCPIVLADGTVDIAELAPTQTGSTVTGTCSFLPASQAATALVNPMAISGSVTVTTYSTEVAGYDEINLYNPSYHWGSTLSVNVAHNGTQPLDFHIHQFPVQTIISAGNPTTGNCADGAVGAHYVPNDGLAINVSSIPYGLGELSNKFGDIAVPDNVTGAVPINVRDDGVRLDGQFGVHGRSIVLHSNEVDGVGERVGCCTIPFLDAPVPAIGNTEEVEAICELAPGGDVSGTVYFRQPSGAGQMGTEIRTSFAFNSPTQQSGFHDWRIHSRATAGFRSFAGDCDVSGPAYEPSFEFVGPDAIHAPGGLRFFSGNLGAKHGFLNGQQAGAEVVINDGGLMLSGPKSVIGRSLRIYTITTATDPTASIGCCNIVRVPPGTYRPSPAVGSRTATCSFPDNQAVRGTITLSQITEAEGINITLALSGSLSSVTGWQVSQYGITGSSCSGGAIFNGTGSVPDYGNLGARLGALVGSGTIYDPDLKLSGLNSILGRSISLRGGNGTIACCSVSLTAGTDTDVRYRYSGAESTCFFSDDVKDNGVSLDGIEGWIRFRQLTHPGAAYMNLGTEIEVNIIGGLLRSTPGAKNINIRNTSFGLGACSDAGPVFLPEDGLVGGLSQYYAGRIGAKHGNFTGDRSVTRFIDNSLSLFGPNSIARRAVRIDDSNGSPVSCCDLSAVAQHPRFVADGTRLPQRAACDFNTTDIKGTILIDDTGSAVRVSSNSGGFLFSGAQIGDHNYHVHLYGTETASSAGGHYRPFDGIGPDANGIQFSTTNVVELGDLSGKHGKLRPDEFFTYTDNQVQLGGPFSVLGRSIVIHDLTGAPFASCVIKAVDRVNYFPPNYRPITISPCSAGTTIPDFSCQAGSYTSSGNVVISPGSTVTWTGFIYVVNGGVSIRPSATLNVRDAELQVSNVMTLNDGSTVNLLITGTSKARMFSLLTYGGVFNIVDSKVTIVEKWDETICAGLVAPTFAQPPAVTSTVAPAVTAPTQASVSLPIPITIVSHLTNVSIGTSFAPCGHLQIDLKGGAYTTPFSPFSYSSIAGRFTQTSYFNSGSQPCVKYTIKPTYNSTRMFIDIMKDESGCTTEDANTYIIVGIVVGAIVLAIIIAVVVIAATPAGIPCRIWYRRTCGAKFSPSGRNTSGF